jgi:hypothetical protein
MDVRGRRGWVREWGMSLGTVPQGECQECVPCRASFRRVAKRSATRRCRGAHSYRVAGPTLAARPAGRGKSPIHDASVRVKAAADASRTPGRSRARRRFASRCRFQGRPRPISALPRSPLARPSCVHPRDPRSKHPSRTPEVGGLRRVRASTGREPAWIGPDLWELGQGSGGVPELIDAGEGPRGN